MRNPPAEITCTMRKRLATSGTYPTKLDQVSSTQALASEVESDSVGRHQVHHLRHGISPQESSGIRISRGAAMIMAPSAANAS